MSNAVNPNTMWNLRAGINLSFIIIKIVLLRYK
jgi:hypothetical protein